MNIPAGAPTAPLYHRTRHVTIRRWFDGYRVKIFHFCPQWRWGLLSWRAASVADHIRGDDGIPRGKPVTSSDCRIPSYRHEIPLIPGPQERGRLAETLRQTNGRIANALPLGQIYRTLSLSLPHPWHSYDRYWYDRCEGSSNDLAALASLACRYYIGR